MGGILRGDTWRSERARIGKERRLENEGEREEELEREKAIRAIRRLKMERQRGWIRHQRRFENMEGRDRKVVIEFL